MSLDENKPRRISNANENSRDENWILPNRACAQSDLKAAMHAIQETIQQEIAATSDDLSAALFEGIQESLVGILERTLVPVADEDFQDYIDLYHVVPVNLEEAQQEEEESVAEIEQHEAEEEIDQDDLLDRKALEEAQQLRGVVRELSEQVQQTREQVLKESLQTTIAGQGYIDVIKSIEERPAVQSQIDASAIREQQVALQASMGALSSLLTDSQWSSLPQQLESLQSTIDVIQKESDKDRPMSQVEAAIISRSNSAEDDTTTDWENILSQQESGVTLTAAERLARFFEQIE